MKRNISILMPVLFLGCWGICLSQERVNWERAVNDFLENGKVERIKAVWGKGGKKEFLAYLSKVNDKGSGPFEKIPFFSMEKKSIFWVDSIIVEFGDSRKNFSPFEPFQYEGLIEYGVNIKHLFLLRGEINTKYAWGHGQVACFLLTLIGRDMQNKEKSRIVEALEEVLKGRWPESIKVQALWGLFCLDRKVANRVTVNLIRLREDWARVVLSSFSLESGACADLVYRNLMNYYRNNPLWEGNYYLLLPMAKWKGFCSRAGFLRLSLDLAVGKLKQDIWMKIGFLLLKNGAKQEYGRRNLFLNLLRCSGQKEKNVIGLLGIEAFPWGCDEEKNVEILKSFFKNGMLNFVSEGIFQECLDAPQKYREKFLGILLEGLAEVSTLEAENFLLRLLSSKKIAGFEKFRYSFPLFGSSRKAPSEELSRWVSWFNDLIEYEKENKYKEYLEIKNWVNLRKKEYSPISFENIDI